MVPLQQPWSTLGVPWRTLGVPLGYPWGTLGVPLGFPCSTRGVAPRPSDHPPDRVRPRTSVGAHPHVQVGGGAILAADDVDSAGGVDHRRVVSSRSPRRAECAARPRHTCGLAGDRPMAPTQHARAAARKSPAELSGELLIPTSSRPCHESARTAPRYAHTPTTHSQVERTCARRYNPMDMHEQAQMCTHKGARARTPAHAHAHACGQTRARMHT